MAFMKMVWQTDDSLKIKVKTRIRNASTTIGVRVKTSIRNGPTSNTTNTSGNNQ